MNEEEVEVKNILAIDQLSFIDKLFAEFVHDLQHPKVPMVPPGQNTPVIDPGWLVHSTIANKGLSSMVYFQQQVNNVLLSVLMSKLSKEEREGVMVAMEQRLNDVIAEQKEAKELAAKEKASKLLVPKKPSGLVLPK